MKADVGQESRQRFHLRLLAGCVVLVGLACVQDAGLLIADTKFDLVLNPGDFLSRALHLWDGEGAFGQLQNQAYGYLWPMGPFFLLGDLVDVPGWLVQRLWIALVMCVAFVGAGKLTRELGVRSDLAALVAAFAYALSPRMITTLGPTSIEAWPSALAPWVLLPLVVGATRGSPRRAAALAALAVAMVGGVNAAATFAVLPLGVLWLLTRAPGPRRRSMIIWWPVFTALGTLWWLVPLFTLGSYSPPFLDYIESASVTTIPTNLFDAWRGTSDWVAYVSNGWRAGNDLISTTYGPLNSAVLMAFGAVGLTLRRNPHRQFLLLSLLTGLLMVTLGHIGQLPGWFATDLQAALDGALKPLRNVHKFDPIIRIPMVVGLAWVLDRLLRPEPRVVSASSAQRFNRTAFAALAVIALIGSILPVLAGRLTPLSPAFGVPDYWHQTADWLGKHSGEQTALLVPGSSFADYVWGSPKDEPLQALAQSRWAVRNAIPLTPPGNIRMLDAIEAQLAQGKGSQALVDYLARAGVRHLVVRNDLQPGQDVTTPAVVHEAMAQMPGVTRVASFGPEVGGSAHLSNDGRRVVINGGAQGEWPAVEIFSVPGSAAAVTADVAPVVVGGPEDLMGLQALGVIGDAPVELAADRGQPPDPGTPLVLTDGLQVRERFFGRINDGYSAVLTPGDERRSGNPVRDYTIDTDDRWGTTARLMGAQSISASSSMSDSGAWGGAHPAKLPFAAIDGDPTTSWTSGAFQSRQAWWRVDLARQRDIGSVAVSATEDAPERQRIRVVTDGTRSDSFTLNRGTTRRISLGADRANWLRLENAGSRPNEQISIAEVDIEGVDVTRSLVLPRLPDDWPDPDAIVLQRLDDARTGCVEIIGDVRCLAQWERDGEEPNGLVREFWTRSAGDRDIELKVRPKPGAELESLVQSGQPINITASSTGPRDPRASALAAVDGRSGTSWSADLDDISPRLSLNWLGRRTLTGLQVTASPEAAVRAPTKVKLTWPTRSGSASRTVTLDDDGEARFPAIRTDQLAVTVLDAEEAVSVGFDQGVSKLPVGISELEVTGLDLLPLLPDDRTRQLACGSGPTITAAGEVIRTSVSGSSAGFLDGDAKAVPCDSVQLDLPAGRNILRVQDSGAFAIEALVLTNPDVPPVAAARTADLESRDSVTRILTPKSAGTLSVRENANPGWRADQGAQDLEAVALDGWQQGWRLTGDEAVTMRFAPDTTYRAGLIAGGIAWLLLWVLAFWSRRWKSLVAAEPVGSRVLPQVLIGGVSVAAAGLLAGTLGVLAVAGGVALALLAGRRDPVVGAWLTASLLLVASMAWVMGPWGGFDGWGGNDEWPLYPTLLALGGVVSGSLGGRPRLRNRMAGSSTSR